MRKTGAEHCYGLFVLQIDSSHGYIVHAGAMCDVTWVPGIGRAPLAIVYDVGPVYLCRKEVPIIPCECLLITFEDVLE
ncbi:hypothetical protein GCM10008018_18020 [Paenibacillus marchantiophytorum]|uniref:Uncharacterized protein n=1 Tax=Paenibacillus marchantiophytorum TaxID=1619310 RepID=A0ABQ2BX21_9BACL|nr:hypothetical protein GCM10008018_18020 [Paenibacillus marchantiophytorum]